MMTAPAKIAPAASLAEVASLVVLREDCAMDARTCDDIDRMAGEVRAILFPAPAVRSACTAAHFG